MAAEGGSPQNHRALVLVHTSHPRERSGAPFPQRLLNRTNNTICPLFYLDEEATLTMSEQMAKRLDTRD
eukprot:scaffold19235_cov126-Isochrysis_galbana.AAC.12